jgi:hypothetical protein
MTLRMHATLCRFGNVVIGKVACPSHHGVLRSSAFHFVFHFGTTKWQSEAWDVETR